jgi:hypothetical protein
MPTNHDIALGESNFLLLRSNPRNYFVDKSHFISRVFRDASPVQLFPRPRRFGKTLNLTMLKAFAERAPSSNSEDWPHHRAFEGLRVLEDEECMTRHAGQYPVIYLTFKDVKKADWDGCLQSILTLLASEIWRHVSEYDLDEVGRHLVPRARQALSRVIHEDADATDAEGTLFSLSSILAHAANQNVLILIDEYDTPILSAWTHGYYDEAITFFRNFLGAGLKDNPHLAKGVLTGILRIAKESVFSGLNNPSVYSLLRPEHADSFGFTQAEVDVLLDDFQARDHRQEVIRWYNGYLFGRTEIYNPWSILNFAASSDRLCRPYWLNTSSNDLVRDLVMTRADSGDELLRQELTILLSGDVLAKPVDDHIVLRDIRADDDSLWSLLAMSGYLKVGPGRNQGDFLTMHDLAVPNQEVMHFFRNSLWQWTLRTLSASPPRLQALLSGLLDGEMQRFEANLASIAQECFSTHDVTDRTSELFYHAFFLGLFLQLDREYEISSNREAGYGRYDIALIPKRPGQRGIILELKKAGKRDKLEAMAQTALDQAVSREYAAILKQRQACPLILVGIALRGKKTAVRWEEIHD